MLDLTNSWLRNDSSRMEDIGDGFTKIEEGTLLKTILQNGVARVVPTEGEANEAVAGFALSDVMDVTKAPLYEEIRVPANAPYTVTLGRAPTGAVVLRDMAAGTVLTAGAPANAGEYSVSGRTLTFNSAQAGKTYRVLGSYEPTLTEAQGLYGEQIAASPHGPTGRTGVIFGADVLYITNFDPASNWWQENPGPVYSGPGGILTLEDDGTEIPGVTVVAAPTSAQGFLGVRVNI